MALRARRGFDRDQRTAGRPVALLLKHSRSQAMLDLIGSNFLYLVAGAMLAFMAVLALVSITDRDPRPHGDA